MLLRHVGDRRAYAGAAEGGAIGYRALRFCIRRCLSWSSQR
jgi:hypothetical protein